MIEIISTRRFMYTPQSLIPEIAFGTYLHLRPYAIL
nr:MAG TPA: hypothetical protein [Caudoviricetes sp.]